MIPRLANGRIDWKILEGYVLLAGLLVFVALAVLVALESGA